MTGSTFVDPRLVSRTAISYPGSDVTGADMTRVKVSVTEEVNKHTLMSVEHAGVFAYYQDTLRSGSPLRVDTWMPLHGSRSWYGYVDSVVPNGEVQTDRGDQASSGLTTEVVGVGITYPLKETSQRVWESTSYSSVVTDLANRAGLVAYTDQDDQLQTIPQGGMSGWQLVNHLGAMSGRLAFTTGSTLNWMRPDSILEAFSGSAPRLRYATTVQEHGRYPGSLRLFEQEWSDNNSHTGQWSTEVSLTGVDPVTGVVAQSTVGQGMFARYLDETARSLGTVGLKAEGTAVASMPMSARIAGVGNPYVAAGRPVYVRKGDFGQWWLVEKVTHTFDAALKSHWMEASLVSSDSFPTAPPSGFPKVDRSRRVSGACLCREEEPALTSGSPSLVFGAGNWGSLPRWTARKHCR